MYSYRICGLPVLSEIVLPGLIAGAADEGPPQVTIRRGAVPASLADAGGSAPTWQIAGELFLLRIPGVARFLLRGGREIAFEPERATSSGEIAIFVIGTVFGILLHQREQLVLHASAVSVNGKAVLFCGPSGAGKSTLAAALGQCGYSMVTDDVSAITLGEAQMPMVQPDGRQLKLWAQAIDRLDLSARRGDRVRSQLEKFYVEPQESTGEALPLGAIYALRETRSPHRDGIEPSNIVDAAILIRRNAYRPRLVLAMKQNAHYLQSAAAIFAKAGVYIYRRPFDFAALPDAIGRLEAHWRELGLTGGAP